MNHNRPKIIFFYYGGYYVRRGNETGWNSREQVHQALRMETSIEEVTYSALVNKICRKAKVDEATTELKLSYIPKLVDPKKPIYPMMMMLCVIWK